MPLHPLNNNDYMLGIFLVGAYQESLSDDHNLMGNFHILTVDEDDPFGKSKLYLRLDAARSVGTHVHHDWPWMAGNLRDSVDDAIRNQRVSPELGEEIFAFYEAMSEKYTYLTDEIVEPATLS